MYELPTALLYEIGQQHVVCIELLLTLEPCRQLTAGNCFNASNTNYHIGALLFLARIIPNALVSSKNAAGANKNILDNFATKYHQLVNTQNRHKNDVDIGE